MTSTPPSHLTYTWPFCHVAIPSSDGCTITGGILSAPLLHVLLHSYLTLSALHDRYLQQQQQYMQAYDIQVLSWITLLIFL